MFMKEHAMHDPSGQFNNDEFDALVAAHHGTQRRHRRRDRRPDHRDHVRPGLCGRAIRAGISGPASATLLRRDAAHDTPAQR
jgi:hypothetical protein